MSTKIDSEGASVTNPATRPAHPDNDLLQDAVRPEPPCRAHGPGVAQCFCWEPGDGTRYDFVVTEFAGPRDDNPTIVVSLLNFGVVLHGDREWWARAVPHYIASKFPRSASFGCTPNYLAAAVLRFVWAYLGIHGEPDGMRKTIAAEGVIR
jgi:hypothetical protein